MDQLDSSYQKGNISNTANMITAISFACWKTKIL
jgi:hypothetical protein